MRVTTLFLMITVSVVPMMGLATDDGGGDGSFLKKWKKPKNDKVLSSIRGGGEEVFLDDSEPNPPLSSWMDPIVTKTPIVRNFVSATLGSNMVLQRDVETILWGYTEPGATITTDLYYHHDDDDDDEPTPSTTTTTKILKFTTTVPEEQQENHDDDGLWRQTLPPQPASLTPINITIKSTTGQKQTLENVLFGDVYLCGGQSNMQFDLTGTTNGTEEAERGENYKHIRVFTVGQKTQSKTPLPDLQTVEQPWSVAGKDGLFHRGKWFSSVCWFFGREISDGLDNKIPIGLISNNWGGTAVEKWVPDGGVLYNAMIHPYMVGPMKVSGFTWYQGESNAHQGKNGVNDYGDHFSGMIQSWRKGFQNPQAYFGFVQVSTWCPRAPLDVPELRQAQMAALKLPKVGYATNADHGDGCNIHPPSKQYCGARLGKSALALQYGQSIRWQSPSYAGGKRTADPGAGAGAGQPPAVIITLKDVSNSSSNNNNNKKGLYLLDIPYNLKPEGKNPFSCNGQADGVCEGANVLLNGKGWVKATVSIQDTNHVVLTATEGDSASDSIVATSYGWGSVPLMTLYDAGTDLPVLPWNEKL